jgi:hypothetical protein
MSHRVKLVATEYKGLGGHEFSCHEADVNREIRTVVVIGQGKLRSLDFKGVVILGTIQFLVTVILYDENDDEG